MPLSAHVTPREIVPLLGDNTVAVRGFNLDDFMALIPNHIEPISKIAELYTQQQQSIFSSRAMIDFLTAIAKDFPGFVMEVISIASDEGPEVAKVKLGMSLQLAVLSAIMRLTVEEAGGLGNLFAQLRAIGQSVVEARTQSGGN